MFSTLILRINKLHTNIYIYLAYDLYQIQNSRDTVRLCMELVLPPNLSLRFKL